MVIQGDEAKDFRVKFSDIIKRYLAGDQSLIVEIDANAKSQNILNQLARQAMAEETQSKSAESNTSDTEMELEESSSKRARLVMADHIKTVDSFNERMILANGLLRDHLPLFGKLVEIGDKEISQIERKLELKKQDYAMELDYRRQLAEIPPFALAHQSLPLSEAVPVASEQRNAFPSKVTEGGYTNVNSYPKDFEPVVLNSLQDAYRKIKCGSGQQTLHFTGTATQSASIVVKFCVAWCLPVRF